MNRKKMTTEAVGHALKNGYNFCDECGDAVLSSELIWLTGAGSQELSKYSKELGKKYDALCMKCHYNERRKLKNEEMYKQAEEKIKNEEANEEKK